MRGRDVIFGFLQRARVGYLFGVPGTNEIPIIDGTDVPDNHVAYIPCLHENIAMGAAMGYARATGRPGVTLLHVTPGIGHAIGNLFNAAKSHIPVVVLCGQQHSNLLIQEPLLASDLVTVARQYTKWAYEVRGPNELAMAMQRALKVALTPPFGPVFLSLPWEFTLAEVDPNYADEDEVTWIPPHFVGDADGVAKLAEELALATKPMIVAGDGVGAADAWRELAELAKLVGAPVYTEQLSSYMNYPNDLYEWRGELPGSQENIQKVFGQHDVALLCGFNAQAQLVVFQWTQGPLIPKNVRQLYLHNDPWEIGKNHYGNAAVLGDIKATLPLITHAVGDNPKFDREVALARYGELGRRGEAVDQEFDQHLETLDTEGPIYGAHIAKALADLQHGKLTAPLTLVNEAVSDSVAFQQYVHFDSPTSYFAAEGGALGYSMPASLGIKLGVADDRTVVNLVGDGSALFYPHTWWTASKFILPILYIVVNNHRYQTLITGLEFVETSYTWTPSGQAEYLRIKPPPELSFVQIAAGFGVGGALVAKGSDLADALAKAIGVVQNERKPYVLEVLTEPTPKDQPRLDPLFARQGGTDDPIVWELGPA
ncbi:MAG: thiamine pyrophosphate-binding protein [Pseudonocardiaceae bacterium]